jgi:hypothetical protein
MSLRTELREFVEPVPVKTRQSAMAEALFRLGFGVRKNTSISSDMLDYLTTNIDCRLRLIILRFPNSNKILTLNLTGDTVFASIMNPTQILVRGSVDRDAIRITPHEPLGFPIHRTGDTPAQIKDSVLSAVILTTNILPELSWEQRRGALDFQGYPLLLNNKPPHT